MVGYKDWTENGWKGSRCLKENFEKTFRNKKTFVQYCQYKIYTLVIRFIEKPYKRKTTHTKDDVQ